MIYNFNKNIFLNGSTSLHCFSISESRSTVRENVISQHQIEAIKFGRM